jgi:soluble lytic murein transglycosylase-like protein
MTDRRNRSTAVMAALLAIVSLSTAFSAARSSVPAASAPDPSPDIYVPADIVPAPMATLDAEPVDVSMEVPAEGWDGNNEQVRTWIAYLAGDNRRSTEVWLERQGKYGPMIRAELKRRGMPQDLLYLALIESGLSPKAYSPAKASGMWQFIAETGKAYGLEISGEVDERRDPLRSTTAALDHLQELYDKFGSWYLAAAAYNTGQNRVERVLQERADGARGDDALFWKIAPFLPRETRNYVPLMLAAGHIARDAEKYGFRLEYQQELAFDTVWVPGATRISTIARASGVDSSAVAELNPHLTLGRTPLNRGWPVRVPAGARAKFESRFPGLYRYERLAIRDMPVAQPASSSTSKPAAVKATLASVKPAASVRPVSSNTNAQKAKALSARSVVRKAATQ